ncbi:MAG: precorrin-6y C5,15-methyltransferase (decarboxylating) subunit CbiE [Syntrophomonadaceae bacterium]|nr:precorrin-6y C5,15-methyltransferase (decarboxylating) subunit CbiE [Syntrophomonadaceae bacterium]
MKKIYCVGLGMGNLKTLTAQARGLLEKSDLLIGAERMLDSLPGMKGDKFCAIAPAGMVEYIAANPDYKIISVIFSGDVGFYSGAKKLNQLIEERKQADAAWGGCQVEFVPGLSSLQYLCAKLKMAWEDVKMVSLHGRAGNIMGAVLNNQKTFFLTGGDCTVQRICQVLVDNHLGAALVHVGERLSYPEERVVTAQAELQARREFDPLSVMLVENEKLLPREITTHGLEDRLFVRGSIPMTKSEIRSVSLSKLQLRPGDLVYDIGAGTGAVSIDIALQVYEGTVYAVDENEEAASLIKTNAERLHAWNLKVVPGQAPAALIDLPAPDRAFIGGSKRNMAGIINLLVAKNPEIRVVINAITLETLTEAIASLQHYGFTELDIVQISAARSKEVGEYHMMTAINPVFIISGQRDGGSLKNE